MRKLLTIAIAIGALQDSAAFAAGNQCVSFDPITLSGTYNALSSSGSIAQTVALTVRRPSSGNPKTQEADFIFVMPQGDSTQYDITSNGIEALAPYPGPTLSTTSTNNLVIASFGGLGQPDVLTIPITVTIPMGADIPAGTMTVNFGLDAICKLTGGGPQATYTSTFTNVLQMNFTVVSALQASFVGPALNFGEIGSITTPTSANSVTGYVRVASTGPYQVDVNSGNNYRMTFPGGDASQSAQSVNYSLNFLGRTVSNASPAFPSVKCTSATLAGRNLAMTATLLEGGSGKLVSPNYQDVVNVTVTPLAAGTGGTTACN